LVLYDDGHRAIHYYISLPHHILLSSICSCCDVAEKGVTGDGMSIKRRWVIFSVGVATFTNNRRQHGAAVDGVSTSAVVNNCVGEDARSLSLYSPLVAAHMCCMVN